MIVRALGHLGLRDAPGALLLVMLLVLDLAFVSMHVTQFFVGVPESPYFRVDVDRSYPEIVQYGKLLWAATLLTATWWRWRRTLWLASAALALYLLLDDALMLHEQAGVVLQLPLPAQVEPWRMYVQEALFMLAVGGALLAIMVVAYLRAEPETRRVGRVIVYLFLAVAFFAILVDLVHVAFEQQLTFDFVAILEDGGEMVATSVLVAFLFNLASVAWGGQTSSEMLREACATTGLARRQGDDERGG